jgi:hypothetical protein
VTANIAANRAAPSVLKNSDRPCNESTPKDSAPTTDWAKFAHGMVSIWLTAVNGVGVFKNREPGGIEKTRYLNGFRNLGVRISGAKLNKTNKKPAQERPVFQTVTT